MRRHPGGTWFPARPSPFCAWWPASEAAPPVYLFVGPVNIARRDGKHPVSWLGRGERKEKKSSAAKKERKRGRDCGRREEEREGDCGVVDAVEPVLRWRPFSPHSGSPPLRFQIFASRPTRRPSDSEAEGRGDDDAPDKTFPRNLICVRRQAALERPSCHPVCGKRCPLRCGSDLRTSAER